MCDLSKFFERLHDLMSENSDSVEKLSKAMNYPKSEIYHWLAGDYMPSLKNLILLADCFSCSLDFLVGKESENTFAAHKKCPQFSIQFPYVVKMCGSSFNRIIKATGISSSTLYSWKNGQTSPQLENLARIADFLDCSLDQLVGRE